MPPPPTGSPFWVLGTVVLGVSGVVLEVIDIDLTGRLESAAGFVGAAGEAKNRSKVNLG